MKLGLSAGPESIALALELGASGVPLQVNALAAKRPKNAVAPMAEAGLEVCQISAFAFNPLSPEKDGQEQQRRMLEQAIPLAPETGCRVVVINGGNYHPSGFRKGHRDNFTDAALDEVARRLEPTVAIAETHGVLLTVEPFVQCAVNTPERFLALKKRVASDALMVNLDICNFFTYEDMWRATDAVTRTCRLLAGHYPLVHVKDLAVTEGVHIHIDETPLGRGALDWETAMRLIERDLPEDGYFLYEHVKTPRDARAGVAMLRELARKTGIEFKGKDA